MTTPDQAVNLEAAVERLRDAGATCRNNAASGSADERQAWSGMSRRLFQEADKIEAALSASNARALAAEEALLKAAQWFEEYAVLHAAKGTDEGLRKAEANAERARYFRTPLASMTEKG